MWNVKYVINNLKSSILTKSVALLNVKGKQEQLLLENTRIQKKVRNVLKDGIKAQQELKQKKDIGVNQNQNILPFYVPKDVLKTAQDYRKKRKSGTENIVKVQSAEYITELPRVNIEKRIRVEFPKSIRSTYEEIKTLVSLTWKQSRQSLTDLVGNVLCAGGLKTLRLTILFHYQKAEQMISKTFNRFVGVVIVQRETEYEI